MDALKPPQRVARSTFVEENIHHLAEKVMKGDDNALKALVNVVRPPALALYFMTSSHHQNQQTTVRQAIDAYQSNGK